MLLLSLMETLLEGLPYSHSKVVACVLHPSHFPTLLLETGISESKVRRQKFLGVERKDRRCCCVLVVVCSLLCR
jgi:hypothetical protein